MTQPPCRNNNPHALAHHCNTNCGWYACQMCNALVTTTHKWLIYDPTKKHYTTWTQT